MQPRRRQSLADTLMGWGFLLSFFTLFGAACFEAYKIVAVIPAAFESSHAYWRAPMTASDDDSPPNAYGRPRTTAKQRAQDEARSAGQDR
jgi:hypothetical protein